MPPLLYLLYVLDKNLSMISVICLWLILSRLNIVKPSFHSVFAAPEYLCDIFPEGIIIFN